jgi:mRNA-degrading endonuclease RelE of RelBE toxin-antitoxin system
VFQIVFEEKVEAEIAALRPFDGGRILNAIVTQLSYEPAAPTRNRKRLTATGPPLHALSPVWELRVGDYRVFYDVSAEERAVHILAVRRKPPHKTTKEIL